MLVVFGCDCAQCLRPDGTEVWHSETPESHSTPTLIDGVVVILSQALASLIGLNQTTGRLLWEVSVPVSNLTTVTGTACRVTRVVVRVRCSMAGRWNSWTHAVTSTVCVCVRIRCIAQVHRRRWLGGFCK